MALLKIASYVDDPQRRAKDLFDLRSLMQRYHRDSERIFSDEVLHADLPDIEFAGAFLLGLDLQAIATEEDFSLVNSFLDRMMSLENSALRPASIDDDWATREESYFQRQLAIFSKGFRGTR